MTTTAYRPTRDLPTNGHRPLFLPDWASVDAVGVPTEPPTVEPTAPAVSEEPKPTERAAGTLKAVAPLVVVNGLAVYGQLAYALEHIAPTAWVLPARIALSIGFAAAVESVALYVGWHAHDALLLKSHATARNLRRWSFLIAAAVAAMNYAHFASAGLRPTAAACAFGLLSLLSPWMWGLHTRRAARLQLLKERKVDEGGAEFSAERRRAFPIRTWQARRWSIDHGVTDPLAAWRGYNAERRARQDGRPTGQPTDRPGRRLAVASTIDRLPDRFDLPEPTDRPDVQSVTESTGHPTVEPTVTPTDCPTGNADRLAPSEATVEATDRPTEKPTEAPTEQPTETTDEQRIDTPTDRPKPHPRPTVRGVGKHSPAAVQNAALLRKEYGDRLTESAYVMRRQMGGWSHERMVAAVAAHKAKADLSVGAGGATS